MKRLIILFIGISFFLPGCVYPIRYDGHYKGKIVDADTGQPIEGVVVLGVWETEYAGPVGLKHFYYDARETLTDKNGEFKISGMGVRVQILTNLEPMTAYVFKVGYGYDVFTFKPPEKGGYIYREDIKWEGNKPIIPLKKLTMEERRDSGTFPNRPTEVPHEKMKLLEEEIYKERRERGID